MSVEAFRVESTLPDALFPEAPLAGPVKALGGADREGRDDDPTRLLGLCLDSEARVELSTSLRAPRVPTHAAALLNSSISTRLAEENPMSFGRWWGTNEIIWKLMSAAVT